MADLDLRAINRKFKIPPSGTIVVTFDASASVDPDLSGASLAMWVQPLWVPTLEPGDALLTATADATGASGGIVEFTFDAAELWTAVQNAGNPNIRTIIADGDLPLVSMPTTQHLLGTGRHNHTVNVTVAAANLDVVLSGYSGVFGDGGGDGTWGSITGTLSAQTDLQAALDAKVSDSELDDAIAVGASANNVPGWVVIAFEQADTINVAWPTTTWDSGNDRWVTNHGTLTWQPVGRKLAVDAGNGADDGLTLSASGSGLFEHDGAGNYERVVSFNFYTGSQRLILPAVGTFAGHVIETYVKNGNALAWHSLNDHGSQIGVTDDDHEQYDLTSAPILFDTVAPNPFDLDGLVNGGGTVSLHTGNTDEVILPPASQVPIGRSIWIAPSDEDASTPTLTLTANGTDTINGLAAVQVPIRFATVGGGWTTQGKVRVLRLDENVYGGIHWTPVLDNQAAGHTLETANFNVHLTDADDTVQKAFDTIDSLSFDTEAHDWVVDEPYMSYADHATLIGNGLDAFMDGDGGFIKDTSGRLWMAGFMASEQSGFVPLKTGCVNDWAYDEAEVIAVSGLPNDPLGTTYFGSGGPIHDLGDGTGMMVLHLEGNYWQKLAAAKVTMDANGPVSVVYLGDLVTPNKDQADCISETFTAYAGSGSFLIGDDGYMYMYTVEFEDGTLDGGYSVARCLVSAVESAIAGDTAPTFNKWDGTGWTEPGIGGYGADIGLSPGPREDSSFMKDVDGIWHYFRHDNPAPNTWRILTGENTTGDAVTWENERELVRGTDVEWYTSTTYSGAPDNPKEMLKDPGFWIFTTASTSYDTNRWAENWIARTEIRHWTAGAVNNIDARDITRNVLPPARVASGTADDGYAPVASGGELAYRDVVLPGDDVEDLAYDNSSSGLTATNPQAAVDEVVTNLAAKANRILLLDVLDAGGSDPWDLDGAMVGGQAIVTTTDEVILPAAADVAEGEWIRITNGGAARDITVTCAGSDTFQFDTSYTVHVPSNAIVLIVRVDSSLPYEWTSKWEAAAAGSATNLTNFNRVLSAADTTVQLALETINDMTPDAIGAAATGDLAITSYSEAASPGATASLAWAEAPNEIVHDITMDQDCTFSFGSPSGDNEVNTMTLILRGGFTPTLPASVDWAGGSPPTYQSPSVYEFVTVNNGVTVLGFLAGALLS